MLLMLLALVAFAAPASAVTLAETVPLFFPLGGANTGFDPSAVSASGLPITWETSPSNMFLCAGAEPFSAMGACMGKTAFDLTVVSQVLTVPVDQNPQTRGATPTASDPFIGTSLWTVTNTSGAGFDQPVLLMFTNVDVSGYPDIQAGLDGNLFGILRQSTMAGGELFYAAVSLGALGAGESVQFQVRYLVNDELPLGSDVVPPMDPDLLVMPPLRLLGVVVPEPGTAVLFATGLLSLAARRGRRRA